MEFTIFRIKFLIDHLTLTTEVLREETTANALQMMLQKQIPINFFQKNGRPMLLCGPTGNSKQPQKVCHHSLFNMFF